MLRFMGPEASATFAGTEAIAVSPLPGICSPYYTSTALVNVAQIQAALVRASRAAPVAGGPECAAVAVIVRDTNAGAEVLLIRRAQRLGDPWSGHIGLPGGRWEPADRTLTDTAVRETLEEVGLDLANSGALLGPLPAIPAVGRGLKKRLTIAPYVFATSAVQRCRLNEEVAAVLWVPLDTLVDPSHAATIDHETDGEVRTLPAWTVEGRVVWGLTYAMLRSLLSLL